MGACCSSSNLEDHGVQRESDSPFHDEGHRAGSHILVREGNKPFRRPKPWTSEIPITRGQLISKRNDFWDTAPAYEGRHEIWEALRTICELEPGDIATSQAILDSINIILPTGDLVDGCYDELGNHYTIPVFCLLDPTNLIEIDDTITNFSHEVDGTNGSEKVITTITSAMTMKTNATSITTSSTMTNTKSLDDESKAKDSIKVRLSTTSKDIFVNVNLQNDTVAVLKSRIISSVNNEKNSDVYFSCRLVFKGFEMVDDMKLSDFNIQKDEVVQALLREL